MAPREAPPACRVWCRACCREHGLPQGRARRLAEVLFDRLRRTGSIALPGTGTTEEPRLAPYRSLLIV